MAQIECILLLVLSPHPWRGAAEIHERESRAKNLAAFRYSRSPGPRSPFNATVAAANIHGTMPTQQCMPTAYPASGRRTWRRLWSRAPAFARRCLPAPTPLLAKPRSETSSTGRLVNTKFVDCTSEIRYVISSTRVMPAALFPRSRHELDCLLSWMQLPWGRWMQRRRVSRGAYVELSVN